MVRIFVLLRGLGRGRYDWLEFSLDLAEVTRIALQRSLSLPRSEYFLVQQLDIDLDGYRISPLLKIDGLSASRSRTR